MKRPERAKRNDDQEIDVDSVRVELKPLFGVRPGRYLTWLYALVALVGLFFLLVYPGMRSRGTYLTVTSRPAGAAVLVDGAYRGATPVEVLVKAGTRRIGVSLPGMEPAEVERAVRGPVFATLFLKPRDRLAVDLRLADADAFVRERLADFADYSHEPGGSSLAAAARILASPPVRSREGLRPLLRGMLEEAMPFVAPPAGSLADFVEAQAVVASDGGVLTAAGLRALAAELGALASERAYWSHWVLLNLPASSAQQMMKAAWFVAEHRRLASLPLPASAPEPPAGGPIVVAGVTFRLVPGGEATIGDDTRAAARAQTVVLEPARAVTLRPFYAGETEVTNRQYAAFLAENAQWRKANLADLAARGLVEDRYLAEWSDDEPPAGAESLPVTGVSHFAARAYCAWLAGKLPASLAGWTARLPTEAEWEWAARGGARGTQYPGGASPGDAVFRVANRTGPAAAGSTAANGFGLRECMGNVWEWCEDWYAPASYLAVPAQAAGPDTGAERVVRGGSWANEARQVAVFTRGSQPPSWTTPYTGFRVVVSRVAP